MKDELRANASTMLETRKKKSIWFKSCLAVAMVVVMLTSYVLIFPARTVERELICALPEHSHDESCYSLALVCGQEEGEEHQHSEECYGAVLSCGLEEHLHSADCYAELEPAPEETLILEPETEATGETVPNDAELPSETVPGYGPVETEAPGPEESQSPAEEPVQNPDTSRTSLSTKPDQQPRTVEFPETGIDLTPYLDSVSIQRQVDGAYVEDVWFENGESVKATIIYDIPKNIVTAESKYVYYQLPEGIVPVGETSGDVMDNGTAVGVYTITEDGIIHILFNDDFANGNAIMGTVEFSSYLYSNDDGTDRVIDFGNDAGVITVIVPDVQKYDLHLEKTGSFNEDYTRADYLLRVSTEKGSGKPIDLSDQLTIQTPATLFAANYDVDSLEIWHVDAEGNRTQVTELEPIWSEDRMNLRVQELPALEAGERYELSYSVELDPDLNGSFELDNEAEAEAGVLKDQTHFFISFVSDITKTGTFNSATGLIDWVITVNPESRPVAGWRIEDQLPYPAVGPVLLTNANGVRYADLTPEDGRTIRYTFPSNAPARPYFIRYSTAAPTVRENVVNSVTLYNERETTVTAEVAVDDRAEKVEKRVESKRVHPDGLVETNWSFHITLPMGELESYSFRDVISIAIEVNEDYPLDARLHYGFAAELEQALRMNLRLVSDGKTYYYGDPNNDYVSFDLEYQALESGSTGNRWVTVDPEDETTHVGRILFTLNPLQGRSFHGYEIVADAYPTWLDVSGAQEGDFWEYHNQIRLDSGRNSRADSDYHKGNAFEKQVRDANGRFTAEDTTMNFSDCGGILEYRLLVDLSAVVDDAISVTDALPAGVELLEDSPRIFYTLENYNGEFMGNFSDPENFTVELEPSEDGGSLVTFSGYGITEQMKVNYTYIAIVYRVRLTDDSIWNDWSYGDETFSNVAVWQNYTSTQSTTVHNEPKRLEKNGVQLTDEQGEATNRIHFSVLINAGAEDLDPESAWVTLTDHFSASIGAELELGGVRLYEYNPDMPDCLGNRVMEYEYQMSFDTRTNTMTLQLLDEKAYVLVYDYTVDFTAIVDGSTSVQNAADLLGLFHSETSVVLKGVNSSATAWQRVITITKVDADNYSKVLPGTEFLLEYWDPELGIWSCQIGPDGQPQRFITNALGKIVLTLIGTEKDLNTSTLYRLTETRASTGYETGNTVIWFLCMPRLVDDREAVYADAAVGSEVAMEDIYFFSSTGGSCVVPNRFNGLTVDKRWFTNDGVEITEPKKDSITVSLYVTTDSTGETGRELVVPTVDLQNPVQLSGENQWSYTWNALPEYDDQGNQLYYFVEEEFLRGFEVSYSNNGITGGTVVISNTELYELPETGSIGQAIIFRVGAAMMLVSLLAFLLFRLLRAKKGRREGGVL